MSQISVKQSSKREKQRQKEGLCKTMESMRLKIPPPTDGSMASRDVVEVLHTPRRGHPTRRSLSNKRMEKSDLPPDADNTTRLATVDDSASLTQNIFGRTWFVLCGFQNCTRPVIFSMFALGIVVIFALRMMFVVWLTLPSEPKSILDSMVCKLFARLHFSSYMVLYLIKNLR